MAACSVRPALHIQGVELLGWRAAFAAREPVVFCGVITLFREALVLGEVFALHTSESSVYLRGSVLRPWSGLHRGGKRAVVEDWQPRGVWLSGCMGQPHWGATVEKRRKCPGAAPAELP